MGKVFQMSDRFFKFGVLALATLLAGCDALVDPDSAIGQLQRATGKQQADPVFRQAAQAGRPQLQLGLVERDFNTVVVLETRRDGIDTWRSVDGGVLMTERGMLRGTRGLENIWLASDILGPLAMVTALKEGRVERFHSYLNGEDQAVTRSFICSVEVRGPRDVNLGERMAKTVLMAETCNGLEDEFLNLYWVENKEIIQSRQWGGPDVGAVSTRVVER